MFFILKKSGLSLSHFWCCICIDDICVKNSYLLLLPLDLFQVFHSFCVHLWVQHEKGTSYIYGLLVPGTQKKRQPSLHGVALRHCLRTAPVGTWELPSVVSVLLYWSIPCVCPSRAFSCEVQDSECIGKPSGHSVSLLASSSGTGQSQRFNSGTFFFSGTRAEGRGRS